MSTAGQVQENGEAREFTFGQRVKIAAVAFVGWLAIRVIGPTLRYSYSIEEGGPESDFIHAIYCFWHRSVFSAAWYWRKRGVAVMTSSSADGEYIARIIERFGFRAVRGSSTRGGARALLGMRTELEAGHTVAFTIDGPKGPRYVAKPGPVLLARSTGSPIVCMHLTHKDAWVFNSWDRFMIPKPFARTHIRFAKLVAVPPDATGQELDRYQAEMQAALDRCREFAEKEVGATEEVTR